MEGGGGAEVAAGAETEESGRSERTLGRGMVRGTEIGTGTEIEGMNGVGGMRVIEMEV